MIFQSHSMPEPRSAEVRSPNDLEGALGAHGDDRADVE